MWLKNREKHRKFTKNLNGRNYHLDTWLVFWEIYLKLFYSVGFASINFRKQFWENNLPKKHQSLKHSEKIYDGRNKLGFFISIERDLVHRMSKSVVLYCLWLWIKEFLRSDLRKYWDVKTLSSRPFPKKLIWKFLVW